MKQWALSYRYSPCEKGGGGGGCRVSANDCRPGNIPKGHGRSRSMTSTTPHNFLVMLHATVCENRQPEGRGQHRGPLGGSLPGLCPVHYCCMNHPGFNPGFVPPQGMYWEEGKGGFGWGPPPPRVPLWSPPKGGQKVLSSNPLGTEGAEAKLWLSASNIGRGGGGGGSMGRVTPPPPVCGRSNASLEKAPQAQQKESYPFPTKHIALDENCKFPHQHP